LVPLLICNPSVKCRTRYRLGCVQADVQRTISLGPALVEIVGEITEFPNVAGFRTFPQTMRWLSAWAIPVRIISQAPQRRVGLSMYASYRTIVATYFLSKVAHSDNVTVVVTMGCGMCEGRDALHRCEISQVLAWGGFWRRWLAICMRNQAPECHMSGILR
jgi:predicted metal-binding protein